MAAGQGVIGRLGHMRVPSRLAVLVLSVGVAVLISVLALRLGQAVSLARENARWVTWSDALSARIEGMTPAIGLLARQEQDLLGGSVPGAARTLRDTTHKLRAYWQGIPSPPAGDATDVTALLGAGDRLTGWLADQADQVIDLAARGRRTEAADLLADLRQGPLAARVQDLAQRLGAARSEIWDQRRAEQSQGLTTAFWAAALAGESAILLLAGIVIAGCWPALAGAGRPRRTGRRGHPVDADRVPARLLDMIGHDLRQPLQAMAFFISALQRGQLRPGADGVIAGLRSSLKSMERMISGLLDISKLDAGRIVPEPVEFAIAEVLGPIREEFAPLGVEKGIELLVPDLTEIVFSDPVLLESILRNIVANAVKYTRAGRVAIRAEAEGQLLQIEVSDTGPGIPQDDLGRIFDEFYRSSRHARGADGLGLGLAVARRFAALLGMALRVSSEPGRGSVFSVSVPLVNNVVLPSSWHATPEWMQPACPASLPVPPADGLRMLVVDDDPMIHTALLPEMARAGVCMTSASSPDAVSELFSADPPPEFDLLVVDYHLGDGLTGADLLDQLAARHGVVAPAVVMTGTTDPEALRDLRDSGYPCLQKPVSLEALAAWLSRRRVANVSSEAPSQP